MGVAGGVYADSAVGFADGGLVTKLSANIAHDMGIRLTPDNNTPPDRIRYFGGPISAMGVDAKAVMPSFKQRFNNSAHSYSGLQIADKVQIRDTLKHPLTLFRDDSNSEVITYWLD